MLSRNIDLTENRDFSSDSQIVIPNPAALRKRGNDAITPEQYDALCKWVHIFGKTWHRDQSEEILGISQKWKEEPWEESPARTCPWTRWEIYLRIPWRYNNTGTRRDDRGWNLFRLR